MNGLRAPIVVAMLNATRVVGDIAVWLFSSFRFWLKSALNNRRAHGGLSRHQIIALVAVFAICVSTLLLFAPDQSQVSGTQSEAVTRAENLNQIAPRGVTDLSSATIRALGTSEDPSGATRQVYAIDRPTSGVLVTLGKAHLTGAQVAGTAEPIPSSGPKFVAAPKAAPAPQPVPAPAATAEAPVHPSPAPVAAPVQIATPAPTPAPQDDLVTATAGTFESDEELIDTAILLSQMTSSSGTAVPQVYTVVAGDSLASIAERFYGNSEAAIRIFEANRAILRAPQSISVGQVLALP